MEPVAVLVWDHAAEPQEQKQDLGPAFTIQPRQHHHVLWQSSSFHSLPMIARRQDGPLTPPPELKVVWNSRAELVRGRHQQQQQLVDDARRKGVNLLAFALEDMSREWEDHSYHQKEDFNASESRRLRLIRKDLLLQRRMCLLAATHLGTNWVCHNCRNLDRRQYQLSLEMRDLVKAQMENGAVRKRSLLVRQHSIPDREGRLKLAEREYLEAQLAVQNRVTKDGRTVPRDSDSLLLLSDDCCLNGSEDDDESTPIVEPPDVLPDVQPPAKELPQETDSSRSISTSSGWPPWMLDSSEKPNSQSHFE